MQRRINPPPRPSTPREAPWREVEEVIDWLRIVAWKLDCLIASYTGVTPPPPPPVTIVAPVLPGVPGAPGAPGAPGVAVPGAPGAPGEPGAPGAPAFVVAIAGTVSTVRENLPTFWTGQKDVDVAGTPVQLDDLKVPNGYEVTVIARPGNTGVIYIGKDKADCANAKRRFDGLNAGVAISEPVSNVNAFWVDAEVSTEGVSWIVAQPR